MARAGEQVTCPRDSFRVRCKQTRISEWPCLDNQLWSKIRVTRSRGTGTIRLLDEHLFSGAPLLCTWCHLRSVGHCVQRATQRLSTCANDATRVSQTLHLSHDCHVFAEEDGCVRGVSFSRGAAGERHLPRHQVEALRLQRE